MKTAVIYARYSSERQTEQSIEGQVRVCNEYAERNNILILDTYIDRAMTGTNDNRTDFQRMLKDSAKQAWDYVFVYKLDRFSRNKYEMAMHKKTLRDNGIKLVSAMENIPDTPEGIILESLLEGMAEYYSAELSQKVRRGMRESRTKGNYTGGRILYGYKVVNKKVIVNEDEAEVVRYIYSQYAAGVYVKDIVAALAEKGIYYHGGRFKKNTMQMKTNISCAIFCAESGDMGDLSSPIGRAAIPALRQSRRGAIWRCPPANTARKMSFRQSAAARWMRRMWTSVRSASLRASKHAKSALPRRGLTKKPITCWRRSALRRASFSCRTTACYP